MHSPMLVDAPRFYPNVCVDGRQDECVDTFYEPPGFGRVYLSRPMVRDSARLLPGLIEELAREQGRWLDDDAIAGRAQLEADLALAHAKIEKLEAVTMSQVRAALDLAPAA